MVDLDTCLLKTFSRLCGCWGQMSMKTRTQEHEESSRGVSEVLASRTGIDQRGLLSTVINERNLIATAASAMASVQLTHEPFLVLLGAAIPVLGHAILHFSKSKTDLDDISRGRIRKWLSSMKSEILLGCEGKD